MINFNSNLVLVSRLKNENDNAMIIFKNDDVYEIIGEDADWCIKHAGMHNIRAVNNISYVAYVCANTHITSQFIKFFKRVIFVEEIPEGIHLQLSLF